MKISVEISVGDYVGSYSIDGPGEQEVKNWPELVACIVPLTFLSMLNDYNKSLESAGRVEDCVDTEAYVKQFKEKLEPAFNMTEMSYLGTLVQGGKA